MRSEARRAVCQGWVLIICTNKLAGGWVVETAERLPAPVCIENDCWVQPPSFCCHFCSNCRPTFLILHWDLQEKHRPTWVYLVERSSIWKAFSWAPAQHLPGEGHCFLFFWRLFQTPSSLVWSSSYFQPKLSGKSVLSIVELHLGQTSHTLVRCDEIPATAGSGRWRVGDMSSSVTASCCCCCGLPYTGYWIVIPVCYKY